MKIIKTISEIKNWSQEFRCNHPGKKIGFVPTMGFLHEGHLSLIRQAGEKCDVIVVSIFVNPIQFNNPEDLKNYPRDLNRDIQMLEQLEDNPKVDILFTPDSSEIYKNGRSDIFMDYPQITNKLCGKTRPGHFSGVLTIVHNFFIWIKPHLAVFGLKDYQQYLLIKKMNDDLHMDVEIVPGALVREADGLAMSSRNVRLSPEERKSALKISQTLLKIKAEYLATNAPAGNLRNILSEGLGEFQTDYASLYNADTLEELNDADSAANALAAVAVYVGQVRLIDNILLSPDGSLGPGAAVFRGG